ncbi:cobalamin adenosyltransferase [Williamsia sp. 1138]|uniref:GlcG/HbpS family heme-binding protein n=1 Tax=Williamsia sp. 1138 TaxID=1903117 RepID=UPI000A106C7C|nr:heme-binding protein [Williamsia sp. 1138]OZG26148.1 cobalamin adenosyltransferase [Williamsia sp. 1138]
MSGTFKKASITAEAAQAVIAASVAKAVEHGGAFVIVVVDESGVVKASLRMDGAPLVSVQVATDKAYTAAGFGISTDGWFDFIDGDAPLRLGAPTGIDRLVAFGGGYPLTADDAIVGAVGVSGGHYSDDMEIAKAGVEAFAK